MISSRFKTPNLQTVAGCLAGMVGNNWLNSGRHCGSGLQEAIEGTFTKNLWVIATMMIVVAILLGVAN